MFETLSQSGEIGEVTIEEEVDSVLVGDGFHSNTHLLPLFVARVGGVPRVVKLYNYPGGFAAVHAL
jgi:hypothetical protein